jgi:hypothetical protein
MTDVAETDTYGRFLKRVSTNGGLFIDGFSDATRGVEIRGSCVTEDATKAGSSVGHVYISGVTKSGTTIAAMGANSNILGVSDGSVTRFILDADGDSHQDVGTAWTNFDEHEDVELLTALSVHVSQSGDLIRNNFGEFLVFNREKLERLKLVTFNEDGHHFVNMSKLSMLLVGAVRQLAQRIAQVERKLLT